MTSLCNFIVTGIGRPAEHSSIVYLSNDVVISIDDHLYGEKSWRLTIDSLDIDILNVYEARDELSEENIAKAIDGLLSLGAKMVLITNGENCAYLTNRGIAIYQPTFNVSVDPGFV